MTQREIFRAEGLPVLQNKMFSSAAEAIACPIGDVLLVQDDRTGLIFNNAFDSSRILYDQDYQNEQACSAVFKRHLADVGAIIDRHFRGRSLIEVGCGKGYFLQYLRELGYDATGIDPAYEGANPYVVRSRFEKGLGLSADGIVLRHVLEHVPAPLAFLADIAAANGGKGTIYIEVPCFDWICRHRAWFDIFYEHVNYFRLGDLSRMFDHVRESGHIFGGQYLFVVAELASLQAVSSGQADLIEMPADFLAGIDRAVSFARGEVGRRNAVWGGASKGVIFSHYLRRAGVVIDEVIDINPSKQGRYIAGTGLHVSAPEEALARLSSADAIFVMNSNYLDEIVAQSGDRYCYFRVDNEYF